MSPKTMFKKNWDNHVVRESQGAATVLYIDTHLIHEVPSPQAFEGLRLANRGVRRPSQTFATMDHNVPTTDRSLPITDLISKKQMDTLTNNCEEFGIRLYDLHHSNQGIVHVIGPQLGITLPGATIVCGDSHTSTQGAFGAFAFGIGTSEVEHVLATQTLWLEKPKSFEIIATGKRKNSFTITSKDIILSIIRQIGTAGGAGHVLEYRGDAISDLSMEQRMTICNMSIEAGSRAGLIAPDEKTFDYLNNREFTPSNYNELVTGWKEELQTDPNTKFDKSYTINVDQIAPQVSWGTNPAMVCDVTENIPSPEEFGKGDSVKTRSAEKALSYMDLEPGIPITEIQLDRIFIGSCTNSRIEDLIDVAEVVKGKYVSPNLNAMIVPGSQMVKHEAEQMGLDKIFKDANFEWRESGCSMCLGMNPDILKPGERCASTSNRNFEGRQGAGGRTHLVSPVMAAAAAIEGHFIDIREWY